MSAPGTQVRRRRESDTDESDHGDSTDARYVDEGEEDSDGKRGKHTHLHVFPHDSCPCLQVCLGSHIKL